MALHVKHLNTYCFQHVCRCICSLRSVFCNTRWAPCNICWINLRAKGAIAAINQQVVLCICFCPVNPEKRQSLRFKDSSFVTGFKRVTASLITNMTLGKQAIFKYLITHGAVQYLHLAEGFVCFFKLVWQGTVMYWFGDFGLACTQFTTLSVPVYSFPSV